MALGSSHGWLVGLSENIRGQRFELDREEILVGRGSDCHIQIKDPKVSRKHAKIKVKAGQLTIEDLGSSHGVLINGERVNDSQLKDGDSLQIGDSYLQVELGQDSIETVMVPQSIVPSPAGTCSQCGNPIYEGEQFCSQCGSSVLPLPQPFDFVHEAFFRLRALHRAGRMDSATFREELEKLVVQDGSGGYWMPGLESGEWFWFNGSEWIRRDPPLKPLVQAPLKEDVSTPPPPPPSMLDPVEVNDDKHLRRLFVIGGGALIAFTILAIGAYAAYKLVNADDDEESPAIVDVQPFPTSAIVQQSPSPEPTSMEAQQLANTPTWTQEPAASATPILPYAIRPYNPGTDENLVSLTEITNFNDAASSPEYAVYEGSWETNQPGRFNIGWCAIDANTLTQNLQVIELSLDVDGKRVEASEMYEQDVEDTSYHCKSSEIVVEFSEPGEHRFLWTTSYSEPVFDGWTMLEPGIFINEFILDVRNVISLEEEFSESSGKWDETIQQNFSQWTEGGNFHIQVHKENFSAWSIYHGLEVADTLVMTHARRVSEIEGAYGLLFRYQDVSNFYYFMVDDSGYFQLGKRLAGEWIALIDWTYSDTITVGEEYNSLGIMATGDELVAFINLHVVGEVADGSFPSGSVGLIAQSINDQGEIHAAFDQFSLELYE